jgi:ATP-dependent RNA helicase RhlE
MLPELIKDRNMFRVLVFTRTKHRAARVAKVLSKAGIPSDEIHGNRTQNQRQRALESFRRGKIQVLVGTDVAARGIDVDDISHVINYEIPNEPETYVHRIGRTARAGMRGEALSMCDAEEIGDFRRIEQMLKSDVEIDRTHRAHLEPVAPRGNGGKRRTGGGGGGRPGGNGRSGGGRPGANSRTRGGGRSGGGRDGGTWSRDSRPEARRS